MDLLQGRDWLALFNLEHVADQAFVELPYGNQREILIARSAIKGPALLILDEPCTGLDLAQRQRVLELAALVVAKQRSTVLHVSHDPEEWITGTVCRLDFIPQDLAPWPSGRPKYQIKHLRLS
jgi:molybdate transport system ATP-binding protein